jgi:nucleolar MIF4G domain-containing protein 1
MAWKTAWMVSRLIIKLIQDLLDFADIIGPGGKGLNQDESGDEEDEEEEEEEGSDFDLSGSDIDDSGEDDEPESDGDGDEDESDEDEASAEEGDGDEDEDTDGEDKDRKEDIGTEATPAPIAETAPTKYIPPSLRAAQLAEKSKGDASKVAEKLKLDRKVQGLLNK